MFLVGGQSNTDARVASSLGPSYLHDNIVDGVKVWNTTDVVPYILNQSGQSGNGSHWVTGSNSGQYAFCHVALKEIADEVNNVTAVQVTEGDSCMALGPQTRGSWNADYANIPSGTPKLLEALENRVADFVANQTLGVSVVFRGYIFHQGESDAFGTRPTSYAANWAAHVAKVRSFTRPDLPVFYGTIPTANTTDYNVDVYNAQMNFAASDPHAYCRDNSALTLFDPFHFDAASCNTFGSWVANTYKTNYL